MARPVIHHPRPCRTCHEVFKPRSATNLFCSKECWDHSAATYLFGWETRPPRPRTGITTTQKGQT